MPAARSKNERVELEMKILRYRKLARQMATNPDTAQRIKELIADLEKELREIASKPPDAPALARCHVPADRRQAHGRVCGR
jgi:hypothetical protein